MAHCRLQGSLPKAAETSEYAFYACYLPLVTDASSTPSPGSLIRAARRLQGQTQGDFAASVGSHQSLISKYERGLVDPPSALLIHCMNILSPAEPAEITEESLVQLIRDRLAGAEHATARNALAALIGGMR